MKDYPLTVAAYTRGRGKFACSLHGYAPCHNQKQVVAAAGYDPGGRPGAHPRLGLLRPRRGPFGEWDQVPQYMHLESALPKQRGEDPAPVPRVYTRNLDLDEKELEAIFLRPSAPSAAGSTSSWARPPRRSPGGPSPPPSSSISSWTVTT